MRFPIDRKALSHPAARFAAAIVAPAALLILGALLGGLWAFLGLLSVSAFVLIGDRLMRAIGPKREAAAPAEAEWMEQLALGIGALHVVMLFFALFALSVGANLGPFGWICTTLGFGLWFGQVSNSAAHELIHRTGRMPFYLGMAVYVSLLNGHHTSAHRLVHHRFAATPDDPNSAGFGTGFYEFLMRAVPGEFLAGYEMERAMRSEGGKGVNPYVFYVGGGALMLMLVAELFGALGLVAYLLLSAHAMLQLLLSDYVQHYGLERRKTGPDSYEPFGPGHAWDAPDLISGLMMLNAPRHADHHVHPARAFGALELSPEGKAPLLPASLPVMATIALVPPVWHRMMDMRISTMRRAGRA